MAELAQGGIVPGDGIRRFAEVDAGCGLDYFIPARGSARSRAILEQLVRDHRPEAGEPDG